MNSAGTVCGRVAAAPRGRLAQRGKSGGGDGRSDQLVARFRWMTVVGAEQSAGVIVHGWPVKDRPEVDANGTVSDGGAADRRVEFGQGVLECGVELGQAGLARGEAPIARRARVADPRFVLRGHPDRRRSVTT